MLPALPHSFPSLFFSVASSSCCSCAFLCLSQPLFCFSGWSGITSSFLPNSRVGSAIKPGTLRSPDRLIGFLGIKSGRRYSMQLIGKLSPIKIFIISESSLEHAHFLLSIVCSLSVFTRTQKKKDQTPFLPRTQGLKEQHRKA